MKFSKPLSKIFVGLLFLASELFSVCSAAVNPCGKPCDPGHFCKVFLGFCLKCDTFCSGINDACQATCKNNKVSYLSTSNPTELPPTLTKPNLVANLTSSVTSETTTFTTTYSPTSPGGGGRDGNPKILPNEEHVLFFGVFIGLVAVAIVGYYLIKYCRSLKNCWFKGEDRPSSDIELGEMKSRPNQNQMNIISNPMDNDTLVGHPTSSGPVLTVAVDDDDNASNQPGPSGLQPPPRPAAEATKPVQPTSASCSTTSPADHPFQSASIRQANPQRREFENRQGAVPSNGQQPKQKTPDTHRKVTDGTLKGHQLATGTPQLEQLFLPGEMPWNRDSEHVD